MGVASFNLTVDFAPVTDAAAFIGAVLASHENFLRPHSATLQTPTLIKKPYYVKVPGSLEGDCDCMEWGAPLFPDEHRLASGDYTVINPQPTLNPDMIIRMFAETAVAVEEHNHLNGTHGRVAVRMWGSTRIARDMNGHVVENWVLREWLHIPKVWDPVMDVIAQINCDSNTAGVCYWSKSYAWSLYNGTFNTGTNDWPMRANAGVPNGNAETLVSAIKSLQLDLGGTKLQWAIENPGRPKLYGVLKEACADAFGAEGFAQ